MKINKLVIIFLVAFILNFIWEYLHSFLYDNYKGGLINIPILLRASVFDALFIVVIYFLFLNVGFLNKNFWLVPIISLTVAIIIEIFALQTGRWAYKEIMPVIPVINIGLSPVVQLPILSCLIFKIFGFKKLAIKIKK